jgi:hypothetical protein
MTAEIFRSILLLSLSLDAFTLRAHLSDYTCMPAIVLIFFFF